MLQCGPLPSLVTCTLLVIQKDRKSPQGHCLDGEVKKTRQINRESLLLFDLSFFLKKITCVRLYNPLLQQHFSLPPSFLAFTRCVSLPVPSFSPPCPFLGSTLPAFRLISNTCLGSALARYEPRLSAWPHEVCKLFSVPEELRRPRLFR